LKLVKLAAGVAGEANDNAASSSVIEQERNLA